METWLPWIERLGLPTMFLVGLLAIIAWMLRAIYKAVSPFVKAAFDKWMGFIDTIEKCQEKIVDSQETQSQLLTAMQADDKSRSEQIEDIFENLLNAAERLLPQDLRKDVEFHLQAARRALRK